MTSTPVVPLQKIPALRPWAIVLAAGQSSRLEKAGLGIRKQFLLWQGAPLFWHSVRVFARNPEVRGVVVVFPDSELASGEDWLRRLTGQEQLGLPVLATRGGDLRQDSVRCGLTEVPPDCDVVLVHDAARPFLSPFLVVTLLETLRDGRDQGIAGVIPGVPVTDTIKQVADGRVLATLDRTVLQAVQTPQVFVRPVLEQAHRLCAQQRWIGTDDASLVERVNGVVHVVPGETGNIKITNPDDLKLLKDDTDMNIPIPCVGFGYDVHRFGPGRPLKLGGVPFPGAPEIVAHSDGDVLLHALADALLGCLGKSDIGELFPDTDPRFQGIDSAVLVTEVLELARRAGVSLTHVDLSVIAQVPKVAPRREEIRRNVARLLELDYARVAVKASTEEGLGFTGAKQGIKAMAVVTALRGSSCAEKT